MHRKNLSASYSAQNIMNIHQHKQNNNHDLSRMNPRQNNYSSKSNDEFYKKYLEHDSRNSNSSPDNNSRYMIQKYPNHQSQFKSNRNKEESVSNSSDNDSSSDDSTKVVYAEMDDDDRRNRTHKLQRKQRNLYKKNIKKHKKYQNQKDNQQFSSPSSRNNNQMNTPMMNTPMMNGPMMNGSMANNGNQQSKTPMMMTPGGLKF